MMLLQREAELEEIVRLVGIDALSLDDRLILETSQSIREDYLHQNAFHEVDTYTSMEKQYKMLKLILTFHREAINALNEGAEFSDIISLPVREKIGRTKYIPEEQLSELDDIMSEVRDELGALVSEGGGQYA